MDIKKPDRTALKSYFVRNAVPTESNFADLIDGTINQKEDGIAKLAGEPLSIQADGSDTSQKKAINFYRNFADPKPAWTFSLNPRIKPSEAATARPGWSIGDADGNTKLFIDQNTGNVGIGTVEPNEFKLRVNGGASIVGQLYALAENAGRLRVGSAWAMPGLYSSDDGPKPLILGVAAGQKVFLGTGNSDAYVEGGTGNGFFKGSLGIGAATPAGRLEVNGATVLSNGTGFAVKNGFMTAGALTIGGTNTNYGGGSGWNANTAGLLFETAANTEIAVHDANHRIASLMFYEGDTANRITVGRDMGWGRITQVQFAGAIVPAAGNADTVGIMFPRDPGGGGGDAAWIRYYARSGEACTLEIGISNDGDDHIALMSSGNVGIGTQTPGAKLHVVGSVMQQLEMIGCGRRDDWTAANHPIMQYFSTRLRGRPVGTYLRAIQDHPSWRGHYWQGWVDADGRIRVIHNQINTSAVI
jgi:hypothetical protein